MMILGLKLLGPAFFDRLLPARRLIHCRIDETRRAERRFLRRS
jgi:hypothetical protein